MHPKRFSSGKRSIHRRAIKRRGRRLGLTTTQRRLTKRYLTPLLIITLAGCTAKERAKWDAPPCFSQIERSRGWEESEVTCKFGNDSSTHEWVETKTDPKADNVNPFDHVGSWSDTHPWKHRR